jgi:hypothetical protein
LTHHDWVTLHENGIRYLEKSEAESLASFFTGRIGG